MGRACTVCGHKDLDEINRQLLCSDSYRDIARQFNLSKDALARHKESHISELLSKSKDIEETLKADSLTQQIGDIREKIKSLLQQAIDADNLRDAHNFVGDTLRQIELEAKLLGQIQEQSINVNLQHVSVYQSPEWGAMGLILARILAPYPDVREEVARELKALQESAT
jgi:polyhydroxyalkanoate synthesis regulator phasin